MPHSNMTILNAHTIYNQRKKPALVQFNKVGQLRFSVEAAKEIGISEEDKITFVLDERDEGIIYFYKDKDGLPIRKELDTKTGARYVVCCRPLISKLLAFFKYTGNKSFKVSGETADLYGKQTFFILKDNIHKPIQWRKKQTR